MAKYIKLEDAIAIIEEKQKELCPVGRYGRGYVYDSNREKYDALDEIIDALENVSAADVAPVRHGRWISLTECANEGVYCSVCNKKVYKADYAWSNKRIKVRSNYCPNCGAKMDGGADNDA